MLRVPLRELAPSAYDGTVDFGAVLEREVTAHGVLADAGVPMARLSTGTAHEQSGSTRGCSSRRSPTTACR